MRFEELIEKHHDEILRYLWRMRGSPLSLGIATPQDLTQATFERAYRAYPKLKSKRNLRAWLYKIATNCALDAMREAGRRSPVDIDDLARVEGVDSIRRMEKSLVAAMERDDLRRAIEQLPLRQRASLILRYLNELSYADCAQILECTQEAVRSNVYQALRTMRAGMVHVEGGSDE